MLALKSPRSFQYPCLLQDGSVWCDGAASYNGCRRNRVLARKVLTAGSIFTLPIDRALADSYEDDASVGFPMSHVNVYMCERILEANFSLTQSLPPCLVTTVHRDASFRSARAARALGRFCPMRAFTPRPSHVTPSEGAL